MNTKTLDLTKTQKEEILKTMIGYMPDIRDANRGDYPNIHWDFQGKRYWVLDRDVVEITSGESQEIHDGFNNNFNLADVFIGACYSAVHHKFSHSEYLLSYACDVMAEVGVEVKAEDISSNPWGNCAEKELSQEQKERLFNSVKATVPTLSGNTDLALRWSLDGNDYTLLEYGEGFECGEVVLYNDTTEESFAISSGLDFHFSAVAGSAKYEREVHKEAIVSYVSAVMADAFN